MNLPHGLVGLCTRLSNLWRGIFELESWGTGAVDPRRKVAGESINNAIGIAATDSVYNTFRDRVSMLLDGVQHIRNGSLTFSENVEGGIVLIV